MRKFYLILFSLFILAEVRSQSIDLIRNNPAFIWGQGNAVTLKEADENALRDLVSQISVNVDQVTQTTLSNEQQGDDAVSKVSVSSELQISSNVSLSNCRRIVEDKGSFFVVLRYVERADIDRMFEARKAKVNDLIAAGERAEQQVKIADALRNYYWALKLTTSFPNERRMQLTTDDGIMLTTHLHEKITAILDNVKVTVLSKQADDDAHNRYSLEFTYREQPVSSCDYNFFDGYDWLTASSKDGLAVVEMPSSAAHMLLRIEYEFGKLWKSDPMVNDILSQLPTKLPFPPAEKQIDLSALSASAEDAATATSAKAMAKEMVADSLAECSRKEMAKQANVVFPVLQAIETRQYDEAQAYCTENGWKWFEKLVKYGHATILQESDLQVSSFFNGYLVRGVKASFSFKKNDRTFVEDLIFYVKDGKIDGINFGLEQGAMDDICRHDMWDANSRLVLINFLENYKTAYALERLDYLDAIFSEDALIIVGNRLPQQKQGDVTALNQESYEHNKLTKSQYIKQLERVFQKQEYVNIHFEDASVKKTNRTTERYEIIIKQNYYSTTYADKGYLYLLADITNPEQPVIFVRVWDEDKNNLMDYGEWIF